MTSASLQNVWSSVKPKVLALFAKTSASKPFSPAEYSALYTEAYNYVCDSGADLCGFYMGVLDLIDEYCDSVRNKFLASPADTPSSAAQLLAFYNTRMKTLFTQCAFLDRVFRPLVTIFVEKMNKDSTTVLCFAHKSKFIWKARVLQQSGVSEKLIAATFRLIEKEHDITLAAAATSSSSIQGKAQSQVSVSYAMLIKDSISGLWKANVSFDNGTLVTCSYDLYMKEFEPKYVRSIEAFYTKRVSTLPKDVSYFNTVSEWIAAEELKTRSYLPQMSESEVSGAVDGVLITANEPFFVEKFDHCLSSGDTDHARLIHTLLTRVGRSGSLSPALFEHVKAVVGKTVSLADPGVPSSVVAAFASAHAQCFSLIADVFCGDSKAKSELSIALRKAFAGHDIQAPRALALYCNEIASRPKKDSSDLAKEVDSIAIVAEFLEDKDVFFDLHETLLAKRLIRFHAESEALDRAVLDRLKEVCGSSFTRRMEHMLADVASSKSVVENFLASTDLSFDFSQLVLCSGSWQTIHIPQSSLSSSFTFPQSAPISRALSLFEDFYTAKFSGRRLTVAYPLSTVDLKLKMPESGHSYTFTSTALQAGTLLLFNNSNGKAEFTVDDIAKTLSTPVEALVPHITGIAKTKMVKLFSSSLTSSSSSESITQDTVVALNPKFFSKRPKFVLPMGTDSSKSHAALLSSSSNSGGCGSEESLDVYADRLERVEACLAHVMKAKKVLAFVVMQDEVRALLSQRFLVTPKLFKKAVESLVEKGYIARSDDDRGLFKYIS